MWRWNTLTLDREGTLKQQVERAVHHAISDGRLGPGDALPSTRTLAQSLGITRNTAVAAYRELSAQGWVSARPGAKTRVAPLVRERVPVRPPRGLAYPIAHALPTHASIGGRWPLGAGEPDLRLLRTEPLARAIGRALRTGRGALLGYRDPRGSPEFLDAIRGWLGATRGVATERDRLISTRGAQHALDLVARTLLGPGSHVAVEDLGYSPAWQAFRMAGVSIVPIPVDHEGLRVDRLAQAARTRTLRAVYVTPQHQYPTTVTLSPARRLALLRLAREHRFAIIEDDYDNEFHYEGPPIAPLAAADPSGSVVYIGTLSKILAPGLRLGFVHAAPELIRALAEVRRGVDRQGDAVIERAVADLVDEGELQRHVRRMRRIYQERRDVLVAAVRAKLSDAVEVDVPSGGIGLWARVRPGVDDEAWVAAAREVGVGLRPGRAFSVWEHPTPGLRMVFSKMNPEELTAAVNALAQARPRSSPGASQGPMG